MQGTQLEMEESNYMEKLLEDVKVMISNTAIIIPPQSVDQNFISPGSPVPLPGALIGVKNSWIDFIELFYKRIIATKQAIPDIFITKSLFFHCELLFQILAERIASLEIECRFINFSFIDYFENSTNSQNLLKQNKYLLNLIFNNLNENENVIKYKNYINQQILYSIFLHKKYSNPKFSFHPLESDCFEMLIAFICSSTDSELSLNFIFAVIHAFYCFNLFQTIFNLIFSEETSQFLGDKFQSKEKFYSDFISFIESDLLKSNDEYLESLIVPLVIKFMKQVYLLLKVLKPNLKIELPLGIAISQTTIDFPPAFQHEISPSSSPSLLSSSPGLSYTESVSEDELSMKEEIRLRNIHNQYLFDFKQLSYALQLPTLREILTSSTVRTFFKHWISFYIESSKEAGSKDENSQQIQLTPAYYKLYSPLPFSFIKLPKLFQKGYQHLVTQVCTICDSSIAVPGICLLCGQLLCSGPKHSQSMPFKRHYENVCFKISFLYFPHLTNFVFGSLKIKNQAILRVLDSHAEMCGAGTGVFFLFKLCTIVICRPRRISIWNSIYLDRKGEEDIELKRGKALFLSESREQQLLNLFVSQGFDQDTRVLEKPVIRR